MFGHSHIETLVIGCGVRTEWDHQKVKPFCCIAAIAH